MKLFNLRFNVKDGFDIVIGNPPYVRADSHGNQPSFRRKLVNNGEYETLWEKWDLFVPFIERGYKHLKFGGVTTMIVSDAFCHAKYAIKPQEWFLKNSRVLRLDFLGSLQLFEAAVHNVIYFFQKADGSANQPERRVHTGEFGKVALLPTDAQPKLTYRAFFPEDSAKQVFVKPTVTLQEICYISYGLRPNSDENNAKGEFVTSDLISQQFDTIHCKPYVEGKHLSKWLPAKNLWIEWDTKRSPSQFCRPTFPALHFISEKLLAPRSPGADMYVCLDVNGFVFTPASVGFVPWHLLHGVRNNSLKKTARYNGETPPRPDLPMREELEKHSRGYAVKYLLAVMNSSIACNFIRGNRRHNVSLYPNDWKKLPIPAATAAEQAPVIALVDRILAAKASDPTADISALEAEIDQLVYQLYGLTSEEIAIVETKYD